LGQDAQTGYDDPWLCIVNHLVGLRLLQTVEWTDDGLTQRICRMHRLVQSVVKKRADGELPKFESSIVEIAKERAVFLYNTEGWIDRSNRWEFIP